MDTAGRWGPAFVSGPLVIGLVVLGVMAVVGGIAAVLVFFVFAVNKDRSA
jgi:hypothetical protein